MWPLGMFPLLTGVLAAGSGHITRACESTSCLVDVSGRVRAYVRADLAYFPCGVRR
jgi:hypothetical protein